jgi:hypothetical protein
VLTATIAHSMGKMVEDGSRECWKIITWYTNVSEAGPHCELFSPFRTQAATVFATVIATLVQCQPGWPTRVSPIFSSLYTEDVAMCQLLLF